MPFLLVIGPVIQLIIGVSYQLLLIGGIAGSIFQFFV